MATAQIIAFKPARAAQLTGLTRRQVDYWRRTVLLTPSTDTPISPHRSIRLYDFSDMLSLMTIAELLRRKVTLQRIRKIVDRMREVGHDSPLTELRWGTAGAPGKTIAPGKDPKNTRVLVAIIFEDGRVVGDDDLDQVVMAEVIDISEIRARIHRGAQRDEDAVGRIERRRGARGSREVFAGTRVPVDTVVSYLRDGVPDHEVREAFPALKPADLALAAARATLAG